MKHILSSHTFLSKILNNFWYSVIFVFVITVGINLFLRLLMFIIGFQEPPLSDYLHFYEPVARNILSGNGIALESGRIATRYPPGYPLLLAGIFKTAELFRLSEGTVLLVFKMLNLGLASVFLFCLSRTVWKRIPAFIPSLLWVTYPFAFWITVKNFSELPFITLLYGSFYFFWLNLIHQKKSWFNYFTIGILVGAAMLIRPIAIGLSLIMGIMLLFLNKKFTLRLRFLLLMAMLFGNFVTILPWQAWVFSKQNKVILLSEGAMPSIKDGLTFDVRHKKRTPKDVQQLMERISRRKKELKSLQDVAVTVFEEARENPIPVIKLFLIKSAFSWYANNRRDNSRIDLYTLGVQLIYLFLIISGIIYSWKKKGIYQNLIVCIGLLTLYFWGMTILALSIMRYMVPVMGLLFVFVPAFRPLGQLLNRESNSLQQR